MRSLEERNTPWCPGGTGAPGAQAGIHSCWSCLEGRSRPSRQPELQAGGQSCAETAWNAPVSGGGWNRPRGCPIPCYAPNFPPPWLGAVTFLSAQEVQPELYLHSKDLCGQKKPVGPCLPSSEAAGSPFLCHPWVAGAAQLVRGTP